MSAIRVSLLIKTRVAAIASPYEGSLVYVKAESASVFTTYAGSDAKVAKVIAPGYYFYSGRKWVKVNNEWEYDRDKLREHTKADGISPRTDEGNVFITSDGRFDHKNSFFPTSKTLHISHKIEQAEGWIGFMRNMTCIIMRISCIYSRNYGFYAYFIQNGSISAFFLPKNLGRELKISQTYAKISP